MIISNNKTTDQIEINSKNSTSSKSRFFNFFIDRYKEAYKIELEDLYRLAKYSKKPRSSFIDGYEALKIANSAIKSLKSKRTIILSK